MQQKTGIETLSTVQVAYTGTSARSGAIGPGMGGKVLVRLWPTTDCHWRAGGSTVAATTADEPLAGGTEHFRLIAADSYVAAIQMTAGGTLHVSLCVSGTDRA